jgi:hypothetical protein
MKHFVVCVILMGLLLCTISLFALPQTSSPHKTVLAKERAYTGTLSDVLTSGVKPEKQNTEWIKPPTSGFGIILKESKVKFVFHKFDAKGNELVKNKIPKYDPKEHLLIKVTGIMDKEGTIAVKTLTVLK